MKKITIVFGIATVLGFSAGMAQTVDLELLVTLTNNQFDFIGWSLSSAGDINQDGYDDVLVGVLGTGRVSVYFGGPAMDNIEDMVFRGQQPGDGIGWSVSAGDLNGDSLPDVIVGAPNNDSAGFNAGRAYIYFGGSPMDTTADVILTGEASGDYFGRFLSYCGDVNGDGFGDVIIAAPFSDSGGMDAGRAYIYFGGAPMDNIADVILTGEAAWDTFGCSVSSAGDVNGDGYDDVIVGALGNDGGGSDAGRAYIYFGGASMDNIVDIVLTGSGAGDNFGIRVAGAGDVNGDDTSDVLILASNRVEIYFGSTSMGPAADVVLRGSGIGSGNAISSAGDVNGDSIDDVLVGDPLSYNRVFLYLGGTSMDTIPDDTVDTSLNSFGYSVSSAGDVNGDNFSDVIVGAPLAAPQWHQAFVYAGKVTGISESDDKFQNTNVKLFQNQPNPFNSASGGTAISFQLSVHSHNTIKVYDLTGRLVMTLFDEEKEAGAYSLQWDGRNSGGLKVPAGTYFYELIVGGKEVKFRSVRKMTVIK